MALAVASSSSSPPSPTCSTLEVLEHRLWEHVSQYLWADDLIELSKASLRIRTLLQSSRVTVRYFGKPHTVTEGSVRYFDGTLRMRRMFDAFPMVEHVVVGTMGRLVGLEIDMEETSSLSDSTLGVLLLLLPSVKSMDLTGFRTRDSAGSIRTEANKKERNDRLITSTNYWQRFPNLTRLNICPSVCNASPSTFYTALLRNLPPNLTHLRLKDGQYGSFSVDAGLINWPTALTTIDIGSNTRRSYSTGLLLKFPDDDASILPPYLEVLCVGCDSAESLSNLMSFVAKMEHFRTLKLGCSQEWTNAKIQSSLVPRSLSVLETDTSITLVIDESMFTSAITSLRSPLISISEQVRVTGHHVLPRQLQKWTHSWRHIASPSFRSNFDWSALPMAAKIYCMGSASVFDTLLFGNGDDNEDDDDKDEDTSSSQVWSAILHDSNSIAAELGLLVPDEHLKPKWARIAALAACTIFSKGTANSLYTPTKRTTSSFMFAMKDLFAMLSRDGSVSNDLLNVQKEEYDTVVKEMLLATLIHSSQLPKEISICDDIADNSASYVSTHILKMTNAYDRWVDVEEFSFDGRWIGLPFMPKLKEADLRFSITSLHASMSPSSMFGSKAPMLRSLSLHMYQLKTGKTVTDEEAYNYAIATLLSLPAACPVLSEFKLILELDTTWHADDNGDQSRPDNAEKLLLLIDALPRGLSWIDLAIQWKYTSEQSTFNRVFARLAAQHVSGGLPNHPRHVNWAYANKEPSPSISIQFGMDAAQQAFDPRISTTR